MLYPFSVAFFIVNHHALSLLGSLYFDSLPLFESVFLQCYVFGETWLADGVSAFCEMNWPLTQLLISFRVTSTRVSETKSS